LAVRRVSAVTTFRDENGTSSVFGGDLLSGGLETLTEFGLAGEYRNAAVGIDADPGVNERRALEAAGWTGRRSSNGRALSCAKTADSEKLTINAPPPASTRRRSRMTGAFIVRSFRSTAPPQRCPSA